MNPTARPPTPRQRLAFLSGLEVPEGHEWTLRPSSTGRGWRLMITSLEGHETPEDAIDAAMLEFPEASSWVPEALNVAPWDHDAKSARCVAKVMIEALEDYGSFEAASIEAWETAIDILEDAMLDILPVCGCIEATS